MPPQRARRAALFISVGTPSSGRKHHRARTVQRKLPMDQLRTELCLPSPTTSFVTSSPKPGRLDWPDDPRGLASLRPNPTPPKTSRNLGAPSVTQHVPAPSEGSLVGPDSRSTALFPVTPRHQAATPSHADSPTGVINLCGDLKLESATASRLPFMMCRSSRPLPWPRPRVALPQFHISIGRLAIALKPLPTMGTITDRPIFLPLHSPPPMTRTSNIKDPPRGLLPANTQSQSTSTSLTKRS